MNQHINVFRFFNDSVDKHIIENNLSRAFSICLKNNSLFLSEYIKSIVSNEDYEYLFSLLSENTELSIDIQIDTAEIEVEGFRKIYAIAMTSDKALKIDAFFSQTKLDDKQNITDIFICVKDIAIIIEVKRTAENCISQLYNQVLPFIHVKREVIPKSFSWQEVIKLMEKVKHVQHLISQNSIFIRDFLELSANKYPEWFEPKPFNTLVFSPQHGNSNYIQLTKRMRQILSFSKYEILGYNDRLAIHVPFGWASEIIPEFQLDEDDIKEYVVFYIWPGNTKQQGYHIFNKSIAWQEKNKILINEVEYDLEIVYNIKFCHFNKFVAGFNFSENDFVKLVHNSDNFYKKSGKWDWNEETEKWIKGDCNNFESFMDEYFREEFNWRKHCLWADNFINTDRTYFTISLGYEVAAFIPFKYFKSIDKTETDVVNVTKFVNSVADAFQTLIS